MRAYIYSIDCSSPPTLGPSSFDTLLSVMYGIVVSVSVTFRITHTIHPKNNYLLARERGWLGTREPFSLICKQRQVFEFLGGTYFLFLF